MQELTLKQLKKQLDKLTPEQLNQPVLYSSNEYGMSGVCLSVGKAKSNLYNIGDDDPSELKTLSELKDEGYEREDIESFDIEIKKGDFLIQF